ncbi:glutathione hydrolase 5 proenzyme [Nasonia vitripennis]|uniref:Uncharacterized protein n=1 Tax=Nasonia vitripennis TaxID=7425 RepID=A0A7M7QY06_NASVI|nr:glutathione hydrolase 5 proenzyme [Nasonia vitripennis]XP_032456258.1 glutathione hydrolase 5 proenzyme [Nasonia vitripennis]
MNYVRQAPTEECPLTKERQSCSFSDCCGFRSIICSFVALTAVITAALILQLVYDDNAFQGRLNVHGAVATDYSQCSKIGTKILMKGGNAVDAAIAAKLCMVVVAPHKTSLGSGGYIIIYNHKDQEHPRVIDFLSNTVPDEFKNVNLRIPVMLRGLEYAHNMFGKLVWQDLFEPSITLAREGFEISRDFANEATKNTNLGIFQHINAGEKIKLPELANTLENVSKFGTNVFYNGLLSSKLFANLPGIETKNLLNLMSTYKPKVVEAQKSSLAQYAVYYPPSLNFAQSIIEELDKFNASKENVSSIESEIMVAEAIIKLVHQLKDPYISFTESRRYTGVTSVDWQDSYVSIVTGLSSPFNSKYMTEAGFVLDNVDNENSLLSLTPIVFYDETAVCGLRGVFSADDSIIAGQMLYNLLIRSMNVSVAVEYPRYYVLDDGIAVENDDRHSGNQLLRDSLIAIDTVSKIDANMIMKSVNVIIKRKNLISGHSDSRVDGLASRF